MLRAAVMKGGVEVVAVNDPFLDVNYMVGLCEGYERMLHFL